jgi:hypothetical protein
MSSSCRLFPRSLLATLLATSFGWAALPLQASDDHGAGHAPAKAPVSKPLPAAAAAAPAALPPGKDPLDHLRERLSEKLGGEAKPRVTKSAPVVVKVVNKVDGDDAGGHGARPARPATRAPAEAVAALSPEPAARLAAIHREAAAAGLPAAGHADGGHALHWAYQWRGRAAGLGAAQARVQPPVPMASDRARSTSATGLKRAARAGAVCLPLDLASA